MTYAVYGKPVAAVASGVGCRKAAAAAAAAAVNPPLARPLVNATPLNAAASHWNNHTLYWCASLTNTFGGTYNFITKINFLLLPPQNCVLCLVETVSVMSNRKLKCDPHTIISMYDVTKSKKSFNPYLLCARLVCSYSCEVAAKIINLVYAGNS